MHVQGIGDVSQGTAAAPIDGIERSAAEIMSALGRVKAKLPVLDRCESFLEKLREADERRSAVFANSGPKRAPYLGTPAASGTVKAGVLGHRETRRIR